MTLLTKHKFQSAKADGTDNTLVKPSNWNDDHNLSTDAVTGGVILGRAEGAGPGAITDMPFSNVLPAGIMMAYAGTTTPAGWLPCDGRSVLRSDYPNLFASIGTTYGAADGLHFSLPDMRGRIVAGVDAGAGRLTGFNTLGAVGGVQSTTATIPQMYIPYNIEGGSTSGSQYFDTDNTGAEYTYMSGDGWGGSYNSGALQGNHQHQFRAYGWTQGQALATHGSFSTYNNSGYATGAITTVQPTIAINYIIRT